MKPEEKEPTVEVLLGKVIDSEGCIDWKIRRKLQSSLEAGLVNDLPFALKRRYEMLLWNSCFKNVMDLHSKKGASRMDSSLGDNEFLSSPVIPAARFPSYVIGSLNCLMMRLIYKYGVGGERFFDMRYLGMPPFHVEPAKGIRRSDFLYAVQFCLVHMGDVLRHQRLFKEAKAYYAKAFVISTHYGHPFNQLGILETVDDNKLAAAYYYMRALHSTVCFANARTNLERLYSSVDLSEPKLDMYPHNLLQMQAALYLDHQVDVADKLFEKVAHTIVDRVRLLTVTNEELLQIFITSVGCLQRIMTTGDTRTVARWQSQRLRILVGFLQVLLIDLLECGIDFLLKHAADVLYTFCRWVHMDWPKLLYTNDFLREVRFLGPLVKLLINSQGQVSILKKQLAKWKRAPLTIDRFLSGFQPLSSSHGALNFSIVQFGTAAEAVTERTLLLLRLMEFGHFVSKCLCDSKLLSVKISENEMLEYKFESCTVDAADAALPNVDEAEDGSGEPPKSNEQISKEVSQPPVKLMKSGIRKGEKKESARKPFTPKKILSRKEGKAFISASALKASLTQGNRLKRALDKTNNLIDHQVQNDGVPVVHPVAPDPPNVELAELLYLLNIKREENGSDNMDPESPVENLSTQNSSRCSGYGGEVLKSASVEINGDRKWNSSPYSLFGDNEFSVKPWSSPAHMINVQDQSFKAWQPMDTVLNGHRQQSQNACWPTASFEAPVDLGMGSIGGKSNDDWMWGGWPTAFSSAPFEGSSPLPPVDRPAIGRLRPIGSERSRRFNSVAP
uniref:EST1_DNA_bind domain-containing protein n=1 Tax=Trichuris muris TaxID=70415 RepID=A0A5S6QU59_TRIMR